MSGYGLRRERDERAQDHVRRCVEYVRQQSVSVAASQAGSRAWARRILDRIADGEQMPDISMRYACAVLGIEGHAVTATIQAARAKEAGR